MMQSKWMSMLLAGLVGSACLGLAQAAIVGTDNASAAAYDDGFDDGDDGFITGDAAFGPWVESQSGNAGKFIGNSTNLASGAGADINTAGESWGFFSFANDGSFVNMSRLFSSGLTPGQTFSVDLAINFRSGLKGIHITDAAENRLFSFTVGNLGNGDDHTVENAATGNGSVGNAYDPVTIFSLAITQTSLAGGTWSLTRSGGIADFDTGTYNGVAERFELFHFNGPGGSEQDMYVNNLAITPEPGSLVLLSLVALLGMRRR
jgi:hypothetical protein